MNSPIVALLRVNDDLLTQHSDVYGTSSAARCVSLAEALASSPAWARLRGQTTLVVRPDTGLLGILGAVAPGDEVLVGALGWQVDSLLRRLSPVSYQEVERACFDLARNIRTHLSAADLARIRLVAIPRGGFIVAGILAYALGVPRTGFGDPSEWDGLTILVDDCAISGSRLRAVLRESAASDIIVAHLHSHPALRRRVAEVEGAVRACFAGRDLEDHAPKRADYAEWRQRWSARSPNDYWTGDPDHVCYPWNEPDAQVWNPLTGRGEGGWRVMPPSWCVKNRAEFHADDLQLCVAVTGPLRPKDDVAWAVTESGVLVGARGQPTSVMLRGSAATMWQAVVKHGAFEPAARAIAKTYGMESNIAQRDLDRFVAALAGRGYLPLT